MPTMPHPCMSHIVQFIGCIAVPHENDELLDCTIGSTQFWWHTCGVDSFDSSAVMMVTSALLFLMWIALLFPISFFAIDCWSRWPERLVPRAWVIRSRRVF